MLDWRLYPHTESYLAQLPAGLDSHPEARVKAEAHEGLRRLFLDAGEVLPEPFGAFVDGRMDEDWIPEVFGNCLLLLARDRVFFTDEAFLRWVHGNMEALIRRPEYREMIRAFSVDLVISGTAKRWATFHRGTTLENPPVERVDGRAQAVLTLTHPPKLYTKLLLENLCTLYRVVIQACGSEDYLAEAEQMSTSRALFRVSWKA